MDNSNDKMKSQIEIDQNSPAHSTNPTLESSDLSNFIRAVESVGAFTIAPKARLTCMNVNKKQIVEIQDAAQHTVISVIKLAGRQATTYEGDVEAAVEFGTKIEMTNSSGEILLIGQDDIQLLCPCLQSRALCKVKSRNQVILGLIERSFFCNSNLTAYSPASEIMFRSMKEQLENNSNMSQKCFRSTSSGYTFVDNDGSILGRIVKSTKSTDCAVTLFDSPNLNSTTKALLIFSSYLMCYDFMVETTCGRIGERGLCKISWLIAIILVLVFLASIITIVNLK